MVVRYRWWWCKRQGPVGMWRWLMLLSLEMYQLWGAATRYNTGRTIKNIVNIFERGSLVIFAKVLGMLVL